MFHLGFFLFQAPDTEEVGAAQNIIDIKNYTTDALFYTFKLVF